MKLCPNNTGPCIRSGSLSALRSVLLLGKQLLFGSVPACQGHSGASKVSQSAHSQLLVELFSMTGS